MLFTTSAFLLFLLAVGVVYYLPLLRRAQVQLLILASLFFYAWEIPYYILLILVSILLNGVVSHRLAVQEDQLVRKRWLVAGITANLSLLAFFKYGRLVSTTLTAMTGQTELAALQKLPLPLGISFYTFQGISLIVDVYYRKDVEPDKSLIGHLTKTALFVSLFPHQIAGPIVRASQLYTQIGPKNWRETDFPGAIRALIVGYFLKMVVADNLKDYTFWLDARSFFHFSPATVGSMLLGYSCQIFADFAGYSLIAIGLARLFGYELCINFDHPYAAASFREFWNRWHISLSSWLRDYLYVPLGGNRLGRVRTALNLLIVMVLGGLWHGAAWGFALWGLFHGVALVLERALGSIVPVPDGRLARAVRMTVVFVFVTLGWSLFRITDWPDLVRLYRHLLADSNLSLRIDIVAGNLCYSIPVAIVHALYLARDTKLGTWLQEREALGYGLCLFLLATNSGTADRFIYFQF